MNFQITAICNFVVNNLPVDVAPLRAKTSADTVMGISASIYVWDGHFYY